MKIGDKVKLLKDYNDYSNGLEYFAGETGIVESLVEIFSISWVDFGKGFRKDINNCDLELIQSSEFKCEYDAPKCSADSPKCQHNNWKTVQMVYTKYDYCLDCGHDWNERNIRDK